MRNNMRLLDLSNKRYGKLIVLTRISSNRQGSATWKVKCDCGVEKIVSSYHLTRKIDPIKSCGCRIRRKGINNPQFKGIGEISGNWWYNHILRNKTSKERKPIPVEIDINYAWDLFLKQNRKCKLSGIDLQFSSSPQNNTASLDRIDSSLGYIKDNVQWVHKDINFMKRIYSQEYFIEMCKKVANLADIRYDKEIL